MGNFIKTFGKIKQGNHYISTNFDVIVPVQKDCDNKSSVVDDFGKNPNCLSVSKLCSCR